MQCTFCGHPIAPGSGTMYVKTDGRIFYFCSSKCEKNLLKLNRNPRESRWTAEHHRLKTVEKTATTGREEKQEKKHAVKEAKPKKGKQKEE